MCFLTLLERATLEIPLAEIVSEKARNRDLSFTPGRLAGKIVAFHVRLLVK
jgi:hypothetical protein